MRNVSPTPYPRVVGAHCGIAIWCEKVQACDFQDPDAMSALCGVIALKELNSHRTPSYRYFVDDYTELAFVAETTRTGGLKGINLLGAPFRADMQKLPTCNIYH